MGRATPVALLVRKQMCDLTIYITLKSRAPKAAAVVRVAIRRPNTCVVLYRVSINRKYLVHVF